MSGYPAGMATESAWRGLLRSDHRHVARHAVALAVVVGALVAAGALVAVAWSAGPAHVASRLRHVDVSWLLAAVGAVALSHASYAAAYRECVRAVGGPRLGQRRAVALVTAGFGLILVRSGFASDVDALCRNGVTREEARRRVTTLGLLEYAALAPATFVAATVLLLHGFRAQTGLLASWVIGVPAGTIVTVALLVARRRMRGDGRVTSRLCLALDGIRDLLGMLRRPDGVGAFLAMAVYWAADVFALGACFTAVGHARPAVSVLVVGYATGYALTRRSLPLAGAGAVEALVPFALSWVSLPLATAVAAVVAYRLINLWLPLVPAAVVVRRMRRSERAATAPPRLTAT